MLKVSLHFSTPSRVSAQNVLGRLDIGYAKLDAHADYKAVLKTRDWGEQEPVQVLNYPRWSASVWDLVARATCLSISRREAVWPETIEQTRRGAFIEDLTAVVEHWPDGLDARRATVGLAHITMQKRRCHYRGTFDDDILGRTDCDLFVHTPVRLGHWDLLTRAYAWSTTGTFVLPERPKLYSPLAVPCAEGSYVALDTVKEPARTGIQRWLRKKSFDTQVVGPISGPSVTEARFVQFLQQAV